MTKTSICIGLSNNSAGPTEGAFVLTAAAAAGGYWSPTAVGYYRNSFGSISKEPFVGLEILDFSASSATSIGGIAFVGNTHLAFLQNKKLYIDGVEHSRVWETDAQATYMWWGNNNVPFGFNVGQSYNIEIR